MVGSFEQILGEWISSIKGLFSGKSNTANSPSKFNLPISNGKYQSPIKGSWYSSGAYSPNVATDARHKGGHFGVDMRAPGGTAIFPLAPGIVTSVGSDLKGGNIANIQHDNGVRSYYAHMGTVKVQKGDKVDYNTIVGTVGDSGNAQGTWPHLHFQVWQNNQITDPGRFFTVPAYTPVDSRKESKWLAGQEAVAKNWDMKSHVSPKAMASQRINLLSQACHSFFKISTVQGLTVYHGTDGTKLESILQQGLKALKGDRYQPKSVYLTYDKETAAKYAVSHHSSKHELPLILEIYISGGHRVKKLVRDELDRPENAQYEDLSNYESNETEVIQQLEDDIGKVIEKNYSPYDFKRQYLDTDVGELTDLRGKNVYKILLEYARNNELNIQQFKQKMFNTIPAGTTYEGLLEISNDGTLILTKEYYEGLHQQRYPKDLPSSTVKSIWVSKVPENMVQGREQVSIAPKLLAHEVSGTFEVVRNVIGRYLWGNKIYDQEKMEDIFESIQREDPNKIFRDVYPEMKEAIQNNNWMAFREKLEGIDYSINEGWFDNHHLPEVIFTKFTPQEALQLVRKLLHNEQL